MVLSGVGRASVVRALTAESAFVFDKCSEVEVRSLRIEGGRSGKGGDPDLDGALTFAGSQDVRVTDCTIVCPGGGANAQTCLTVRSLPDGTARPDLVCIDHNEFFVGAFQIGVLVVDPVSVVIEANRVRAVEVRDPVRISDHPLLVRNLANLLLAAAPAPPAPGTGGDAAPAEAPILGVRAQRLLTPLADAYRTYATPDRVARFGSDASTARRFVRGLTNQPIRELDPELRAVLKRLARVLQPALQGIVVGGTAIGTVQVLDNLVEGTIQGIHVGASNAHVDGRELVGDVMISRNVVHAAVPLRHDRERHAVFVGNAQSVHILDTIATLVRPDASVILAARGTPVEAVRVYGQLGPFLVVRHTSARGFAVGVRVTPLEPLPNAKQRLWLVAETAAAGGSAGAQVPPTVISQNNMP